MFRERVVPAIVCRHRHDGPGTIACQYVVGHPNGKCFPGKRVSGVRPGEDTGDRLIGHPFSLGFFLAFIHVLLHRGTLFVGSELIREFAFGGQHHKGNPEDGIGTGSENIKRDVCRRGKMHHCSFAAADPVALCLLE